MTLLQQFKIFLECSSPGDSMDVYAGAFYTYHENQPPSLKKELERAVEDEKVVVFQKLVNPEQDRENSIYRHIVTRVSPDTIESLKKLEGLPWNDSNSTVEMLY
jgi:hypothetical protein